MKSYCYYMWATKKYHGGYHTNSKYNDIFAIDKTATVLSQSIAFLIGHEVGHQKGFITNVPNLKHEMEHKCDEYSIGRIIANDIKDNHSFFLSICITFTYLTAVQISGNIAANERHPDPWLRLQKISNFFDSEYEEPFKAFMRSISNIFRSFKIPDERDSLFSIVNGLLFFALMIEDHTLVPDKETEYSSHELLAKDLFKILSARKAECI